MSIRHSPVKVSVRCSPNGPDKPVKRNSRSLRPGCVVPVRYSRGVRTGRTLGMGSENVK